MTDSVPAFISELIRAANETQRLSHFERGRLMERAAATIRDYREQIAYSDAPDNDTGPGDIFNVNPLKEGEVVDLMRLLKDADPSIQKEILDFAAFKLGKKAG